LTSVIPMTLLASVEVDSIKITIVAWLKWFSISVFGLLIASLWLVYIALFCNVFPELSQTIYMYTQNFVHRFHPVLFLLAVTITVIWFTLISRRHIRGREMITNYACGMTCVIILFECLYLPIVDSSLDFKHMVRESQPFISNNSCVATNENNNIQSAVWYYYANTSLIPVNNINKSGCNQAIVANNTKRLVDYTESWNVVWQYQRPVDKMNGRFYMLLNKKESL